MWLCLKREVEINKEQNYTTCLLSMSELNNKYIGIKMTYKYKQILKKG